MGNEDRQLRDTPGGPLTPAVPRSAAYIPAIDGLRALAVAAVLFYHAGFSWMPGGFLGVEVFFVISGYLVTSILLREYERDERIGLRSFWRRRFWRLYPASTVAIGFALVYSAIFLTSELADLRSDAFASLLFVSNWNEIANEGSYFTSFGRPSLLKHFWSLAVEWQFYFVWPAVALVVLRLGGRRALAVTALAVAAGSAIEMALLYSPTTDPSRIYFGTDTRLTGLMLGAFVGICWTERVRTAAVAKAGWFFTAGAALGLAYLAYSVFAVHELDAALYQGGFAFVGLATVAVLLAASDPRTPVVGRVLGSKPMAFLGLRSYGLYLWHWPIFMLMRPGADIDLPGFVVNPLRFAIALLAAEVCFRFVEEPFRRGWRPWKIQFSHRPLPGLSSRWTSRVSAGVSGMFVGLGLSALGIAVVTADSTGLPSYIPSESVQAVYTVPPANTAQVTPTATRTPTAAASQFPNGLSPRSPADASPTPTAEPSGTTPAATETPTPEPATPTPTLAPATETAPPEPTPTPTPIPPPPAAAVSGIGDSVMLGAAPWMPYAIGEIAIDAAVARQVSDGIAVVRRWSDAGTLGPTVVIHLGTNGTFTSGQFDDIMAAAGGRHVVFVTLIVDRPWTSENNDVIRAGVGRHGNASLADWAVAGADHPEYFEADGVHLTPPGAEAYSATIAAAIG